MNLFDKQQQKNLCGILIHARPGLALRIHGNSVPAHSSSTVTPASASVRTRTLSLCILRQSYLYRVSGKIDEGLTLSD